MDKKASSSLYREKKCLPPKKNTHKKNTTKQTKQQQYTHTKQENNLIKIKWNKRYINQNQKCPNKNLYCSAERRDGDWF